MGPFAYILPPENAQIHCGAAGLALFRRPQIGRPIRSFFVLKQSCIDTSRLNTTRFAAVKADLHSPQTSSSDQRFKRSGDIALAHQGFTHQHRIGAGTLHAIEVVAGEQA